MVPKAEIKNESRAAAGLSTVLWKDTVTFATRAEWLGAGIVMIAPVPRAALLILS